MKKQKSLLLSGIIFLTALVMLFIVQGSQMTAQAEDNGNTYVNLYKNDTYVQRFDTVNQAFDQMTDASADYRLEMSGSQTLSGYEQWPSVKSITITVPHSDEEYGWSTMLALEAANTTVHCDVHLKDWVTLSGNTFNLGNYSLIIDESEENYVHLKNIHIIGDADAKMIFNGGCQGFPRCTVNVPTVIESSTGFFDLLNIDNDEKNTIENWYSYRGSFSVNGNVEINHLYSIDDTDGTEKAGMLTMLETSAVIHNISAEKIYINVDTFSYIDVDNYNQILKFDGVFDGEIKVSVLINSWHDDYTHYELERDLSKLLYAPNVHSDITMSYIHNSTSSNGEGSTPYTFETVLEQRDGYYGYYEQFPEFDIDGRIFFQITETGDYTRTLSFKDTEHLKNISYTVSQYYVNENYFNEISDSIATVSTSGNAFTLHVKNLDNVAELRITVEAEYASGNLSIEIPVYVVEPVDSVAMDQSYVEFKDGYFNTYSYIVNLTYDRPADTSKENVQIYSTDLDIIDFVTEKTDTGYQIKVSAIGCGTASVKALVNGKMCECNFKVDMPVTAYESEDTYNQTAQRITNTTWTICKGDGRYVEAIPVIALSEKVFFDYDISFEVADESILKIDGIKNYLVYATALKKGSTTLTITCNGFVTQIPVTVTDKTIGEIDVPDNYTGMIQNDMTGEKYWFDDGIMATDKQVYNPQDGAWYWFDANGKMAVNKDVFIPKSNEDRSEGKWVRYDSEGHMVKGEDYANGGWYRFDEITGEMAKGFYTLEEGDNTKLYYYNTQTGIMEHGMVNINGVEYAFDDVTGVALDKAWYSSNGMQFWYENGIRQGMEGRGKEIYDPASDGWYWLDAVDGGKKAVSKDVYQESYAGVYADNKENQTGKWVRYDANGRMLKGWQTNENGTYYFDYETGAMAKGTAVIDKVLYMFNKTTGQMEALPSESGEYFDGYDRFGNKFVEKLENGCYIRYFNADNPYTLDTFEWIDDGRCLRIVKDFGTGTYNEVFDIDELNNPKFAYDETLPSQMSEMYCEKNSYWGYGTGCAIINWDLGCYNGHWIMLYECVKNDDFDKYYNAVREFSFDKSGNIWRP